MRVGEHNRYIVICPCAANHEIVFVELYCLRCEIMQGGDRVSWDRCKDRLMFG